MVPLLLEKLLINNEEPVNNMQDLHCRFIHGVFIQSL